MQVRLASLLVRHPVAARGARPALGPVTLDLRAGEQVAVIGPSGAGKTTLLQAMACALRPQDGTLQLDGIDPWQLPASGLRAVRGRLLLAPQVPPLPPRQRVVTAVLAGRLPRLGLWRSLGNLVRPVGLQGAHDALAQFDLAEKLFERVDRLSGGERQRVGLARALVADASLLLVDEPLSALDPSRAEQALRALTQAATQRGATLVSTMHDVGMALRHFPRVIGLRDGNVLFDKAAQDVGPELLATLYDGRLDELSGPAPEPPVPSAPAVPVVMQCR